MIPSSYEDQYGFDGKLKFPYDSGAILRCGKYDCQTRLGGLEYQKAHDIVCLLMEAPHHPQYGYLILEARMDKDNGDPIKTAEFFLLPKISMKNVLELSEAVGQQTVFFKDANGCREVLSVCKNGEDPVVQRFVLEEEQTIGFEDANRIFVSDAERKEGYSLTDVTLIEPPRASNFGRTHRLATFYSHFQKIKAEEKEKQKHEPR